MNVHNAGATPEYSAAIDKLQWLQEELEREKQQRHQAEHDFEELVGTVAELRA